jgi:DNA-binding MarR family transcriptional regulator
MQQMQSATNESATPEACAALLLEVAPLVVRTIRTRMRGQRDADLSVPQFRALGHVYRHPGVSLSAVAEHLGLSVPATSRLVEGLVARDYVVRQHSATDRRTVELTIAPRGSASFAAARQTTHMQLAARLQSLAPAELETLASALRALRPLFTAGGAPVRNGT